MSPTPGPSTPPHPTQRPSDTPLHQCLASYAPYSSTSGIYQEPAYVQAAAELGNKFISTSADNFVDLYFKTDPDVGPPPDLDKDVLLRISQLKPEKMMYDPLIAALKPAVAENWSLVNTSDHVDPHSTFIHNTPVKPDITFYGSTPPSNGNVCRSCDAELFLELKTDLADDPFEDTEHGVVPRSAARGRDTRGQVITYLNAMQASQLRTHSFGALIIANHCRLFRLTRSALEVTERFDYTKSALLAKFLWRLSHAAPDVRGLDTTFEKITAEDPGASRARELLEAIGKPLWSVAIRDRSFYVSHPFTRAYHLPVGRGTRCFFAVETKSNRICLLKDTWRVDEYHPEGEVYARLKEKKVRNIPNVIVAQDVGGHYHYCGYDDWPLSYSLDEGKAIRNHQHYRLVLDVVGRPLAEFRSTHDLVKCMLDALQSHCDAWTEAEVEHRDISVGNIIFVVEEGIARGLLIDWELSRYKSDQGARTYERTGTRQFMSARLSSATEPQVRELADDLESFLLVMLWLAVLYAPGTMTAKARADELQAFDNPNPQPKRLLISNGRSTVGYYNLASVHFEHLLGMLLDGFKDRCQMRLRMDRSAPPSTVHLESHAWIMERLREALEDETWRALKDAGKLQPIQEPEVVGLKRKSEMAEYEGVREARHKQVRKAREDDVFT
ncbi:hypothetical protein GGX14DRAFT_662163 [Mycena pura]|uniref:Fungal-type protein kinase domain-containing protein n=1 Tax=Mycena pura TaxID=153505 RepID=A0AAD6UZZ0_9AGAR|nr:hypothetical protein GGX14DRAFT_662163 [Mycena pura]